MWCESHIASFVSQPSTFHPSHLSIYSPHFYSFLRQGLYNFVAPRKNLESPKMSDWGPVFVAVVLFVLLSPGLLIQVPGRNRFVEFGNFQTSGVSVLVHAIIYFALICIFLLAIGIHVYMGWWCMIGFFCSVLVLHISL